LKFCCPDPSIRALLGALLCSACLAFQSEVCAADVTQAQQTADPITNYSLSIKQAMKLVEIATATAQSRHLAMSFAVLDPGGHLIMAVRMDGAPFASVDFARGKAFASVALGGQSGATLEQRFKDDPSEYSNVSGAGYFAPFLPARGVFPVFVDGHLLGAVGASGAPSEIDDQVVKGAIEAIGATTVR
jgi:glc operon protein GlcG